MSKRMGGMTRKKLVWLGVGAALLLAVLLFRPFGLDVRQALVLGTLLAVLVCWTSGCVPKWIAALALLAVFSLAGSTPLKTVFQFPLSKNFIFIFFSFLFSQGIASSGLIRRFLLPLLGRCIDSAGKYIVFVALCAVAMIFIIPQPFVRVILLAGIIGEYLDGVGVEKKRREVLMFFVYCLSVTANMLFLRGDVIMNCAVLSFGEITLTEGEWARAMALPTAALLVVEMLMLRVVFGKTLAGVSLGGKVPDTARGPMTGREKLQLGLIAAVIVLMATESLHGVGAWIVITVGTAALFAVGLLKLPDFKKVNYELLVFFTAAFSIGPVMKNSGVADVIFTRFSALLPQTFDWRFLLVVVVITMALHMVLGSAVSTTSVVVPGLLFISFSGAPTAAIVLAIYVTVYAHFLLPIHNVVLLIGNKDYGGGVVTKTGALCTLLIPACILFVYYPWWRLTGLL